MPPQYFGHICPVAKVTASDGKRFDRCAASVPSVANVAPSVFRPHFAPWRRLRPRMASGLTISPRRCPTLPPQYFGHILPRCEGCGLGWQAVRPLRRVGVRHCPSVFRPKFAPFRRSRPRMANGLTVAPRLFHPWRRLPPQYFGHILPRCEGHGLGWQAV